MGLRLRKSINLGGGFRVNLSKSGIGYSWGTKGVRFTKKAGGGSRRTLSVPGTGVSWVSESGKRKKSTHAKAQSTPNVQINNVEQDYIYQDTGADVSEMVNDNSRDFIEAVKSYSMLKGIMVIGIWVSLVLMFVFPPLLIVLLGCMIGLIYIHAKKRIVVDYTCDEYGNRRIQMMNQAMAFLCNNAAVWQVDTLQNTTSQKTNGGADGSVGRIPVKFQKKPPYFMKTDATCYYVKLKNDQVFILPDRLVFHGNKGWGVVEYKNLSIEVVNAMFLESSNPPKDAKVVGYNWLYVNKNGTPDKRYSNNRQLPKCEYGLIGFEANPGLCVALYVSNVQNAEAFKDVIEKMKEEAKQME